MIEIYEIQYIYAIIYIHTYISIVDQRRRKRVPASTIQRIQVGVVVVVVVERLGLYFVIYLHIYIHIHILRLF